MAAAVADFRPADVSGTKSRSATTPPTPSSRWSVTPTSCMNSSPVRDAGGHSQLIVGFAAETGDADGDVLEYAGDKLQRKGCDLLVVNHVGSDKVFGEDTQLRSHPFPRPAPNPKRRRAPNPTSRLP